MGAEDAGPRSTPAQLLFFQTGKPEQDEAICNVMRWASGSAKPFRIGGLTGTLKAEEVHVRAR